MAYCVIVWLVWLGFFLVVCVLFVCCCCVCFVVVICLLACLFVCFCCCFLRFLKQYCIDVIIFDFFVVILFSLLLLQLLNKRDYNDGRLDIYTGC